MCIRDRLLICLKCTKEITSADPRIIRYILHRDRIGVTGCNIIPVSYTHLYHLTDNGLDTIQYFKNKISPAIQRDIDEFLKEKKYDLKEEVSVKSDYYLNTNHEYEVCCQIVENGFSLIDLKLTVPTESEAEAIAGNWASQSQDIYTLLLAKLL